VLLNRPTNKLIIVRSEGMMIKLMRRNSAAGGGGGEGVNTHTHTNTRILLTVSISDEFFNASLPACIVLPFM
jgi:hypothetical protein